MLPSPDNLSPSAWAAKPAVRFAQADFQARVGPYPVALISSTLESTGLVMYRHLLAVANPAGDDVYFVSAESNPLEGPDRVYFCTQDPTMHSTWFDSRLLLVTPVFFCFACQQARCFLGMDWTEAPLIEPERQALLRIPAICDEYVPDWRTAYRSIIERLLDGIPEDVAEREFLRIASSG